MAEPSKVIRKKKKIEEVKVTEPKQQEPSVSATIGEKKNKKKGKEGENKEGEEVKVTKHKRKLENRGALPTPKKRKTYHFTVYVDIPDGANVKVNVHRKNTQ